MSDLIKLNLGACETRIPGFLSVDIRSDVGADIVADLRSADLWEESSVGEIYCSHMLEHIRLGEAWKLLERMSKWLAPGGILWIAVPDFAALATRYIGGDWNEVGTLALLWGGEGNTNSHKFGWTRDYLCHELERFGFRVLCDFDPWVKEPRSGQFDWSRAPSVRLKCERKP